MRQRPSRPVSLRRGEKWLVLLVGLISLGHALGGASVASATPLPAFVGGEPLPSLAPMLERVTPAVVNVATRSAPRRASSLLFNDPFFQQFFRMPQESSEARSLGSGVIVDQENGLLLTNHHVVKGAAEITVTLRDGRRFNAEIIGNDPESDIAVLRIDGDRLVGIPIANSGKLRVGDFVVAIGNPFGLGQTVTSGIVSALGRRGLGIEGYEDFIQTDASINVGNSGGALVNLRGELVGINTAILAPTGGSVGIGFAIPSNMALSIMKDLVTHGRVRRGLLGIATQDLNPQLAEAFGVEDARGALVVRVGEGTPADAAGLQPGDVIVEVNARMVENSSELGNAIGLTRAGEPVTLGVVREGKRRQIETQLVDRNERAARGEQFDARLAGIVFGEIVVRGRDGEAYGGVQVLEIDAQSVGARTGLRPGDFVTGANRRRVASLADFDRAVGHDAGRLMLRIRRGDAGLFLLVE